MNRTSYVLSQRLLKSVYIVLCCFYFSLFFAEILYKLSVVSFFLIIIDMLLFLIDLFLICCHFLAFRKWQKSCCVLH